MLLVFVLSTTANKNIQDPRRHQENGCRSSSLQGIRGEGGGALPKGKTCEQEQVKKLWIDGKVSEDREEWTRCTASDATMTMKNDAGARRKENKKQSGNCSGARGKLMKKKAHGARDCLVTEKLRKPPWKQCMKSHTGFDRGFVEGRSVGLRQRGRCFGGCFGRNWTQNRKKGIRTIALMSVMVSALREELEPVEWSTVHIGAGRGVDCEHMQALVKNIQHRHCEAQEGRRDRWVPRFKCVCGQLGCADSRCRGDTRQRYWL